jgi:hypothetical protein
MHRALYRSSFCADIDNTAFSGTIGVQVQEFDFWMSGTNATLDIGIPVTFGADALTFGGG